MCDPEHVRNMKSLRFSVIIFHSRKSGSVIFSGRKKKTCVPQQIVLFRSPCASERTAESHVAGNVSHSKHIERAPALCV